MFVFLLHQLSHAYVEFVTYLYICKEQPKPFSATKQYYFFLFAIFHHCKESTNAYAYFFRIRIRRWGFAFLWGVDLKTSRAVSTPQHEEQPAGKIRQVNNFAPALIFLLKSDHFPTFGKIKHHMNTLINSIIALDLTRFVFRGYSKGRLFSKMAFYSLGYSFYRLLVFSNFIGCWALTWWPPLFLL